jgi:hypothetical protein
VAAACARTGPLVTVAYLMHCVNLLLCTLRVMRMLALQSQKLGILMITSIQIISKDIKVSA